ncbi:pyruvate ferredoxin oxidoreductase [Candidatus Atribacteria bacterium 1244-E10-H5-B2]|nr:MAG: pyruvate ferredoxin oxidoreductase [Candidatus Atribacteria bacterium 1244-E10-H5-B2]
MSNKITAITGNDAVAYAIKQINPDVMAAYPITPQTALVQKFSEYVADGLVDTEFVTVESEHSAMSACVGAAAAGGRVMTATAANGLALMLEIVYIAASNKLPIVMPVINRALSAPINIHCDHSDTMGARDSGWIQIFSENAQEAYDNTIQAIRIAEHMRVRLPVMVMQDGFITSHSIDCVEFLEDDKVTKFIGKYQPRYPLLDVDHPVTYGPLDLYDYYFEHKRQQAEAIKNAQKVVVEVDKEFKQISGRGYGLFEEYYLSDAERAIVVLSSTAGTAKQVVDELRAEGEKVGLLKLRLFRPFPYKEISQALSHLKVIAILDRSDSFGGFGGPLFTEIRSALLESEKIPQNVNYIYGLGGRDINQTDIVSIYADLDKIAKTGKVKERVKYFGVRE